MKQLCSTNLSFTSSPSRLRKDGHIACSSVIVHYFDNIHLIITPQIRRSTNIALAHLKYTHITLQSNGHTKSAKAYNHSLLRRTMSKMQDIACDFHANESIKNEKLIYPAASRNKEPILQVLQRFIICDGEGNEEENALFLEIASGSGQHLAHFAPHFPTVQFQPTEVDENLLGSIKYYADNCSTKNIKQPLSLDIREKLSLYGFEENSIDYIYNANMIHISPYECTIGLFENAGCYLKPDALMITYGPFSKDGVITPESNIQFDTSLKARDPSWGLRDLTDLTKLAEQNNLSLMDVIEMPANNKTLVWKKN